MGKTGLQLSTLSFGSWVTFHKQINDGIADTLMGMAYDAGVNFFDNAEVYAAGESEKMMGRVLAKKKWDRTSYVLSSKAYFGWRGKENKPNQTGLSRKHLTEACHEALQRMQTDYLDLYFCHRPDKTTPIEEVVHTMNTLIQQGKILYWGTSEWSGVEIMEAHRVAEKYRLIGPSMEQPQYNMFERQKVEVEYKEEVEEQKESCFDFDSFWEMYPHKVAKQKCETKYKNITEKEREQIKLTLPKFLSYKPFDSYTHPNPEAYLNQKRWQDVIPEKIDKPEQPQETDKEYARRIWKERNLGI